MDENFAGFILRCEPLSIVFPLLVIVSCSGGLSSYTAQGQEQTILSPRVLSPSEKIVCALGEPEECHGFWTLNM